MTEMRSPTFRGRLGPRPWCIPLLVVVAAALAQTVAPVVLAQGDPPIPRLVRIIEADDGDDEGRSGTPFPPGTGAYLEFDRLNGSASLHLPGASRSRSFALPDPINFSYARLAGGSSRLLLLDDTHTLVQIEVPSAGAAPAPRILRIDASVFGVHAPRGLAIDPTTGRTFILDAARRKIVIVDELAGPVRGITEIAVPAGLGDLRGIAFTPADGHLHLFSPSAGALHEFDGAGLLLASRQLPALGRVVPGALTFAPSTDGTDDPSRMNLFLAAPAGPAGQVSVTEWSLSERPAVSALATEVAPLVRVIDTSAFDPPSPDPSGIAYDPVSGTLLVGDGEVDEMSIYEGFNVFKVSRSGALLDVFDTTSFSDEPVGMAINPANGHCYISDDTSPASIYVVNPGPDGTCLTGDDTVNSFETGDFDCQDPEGVAFGQGTLFVIDGLDFDLFKLTPGANGVFDGVDPGDDQVTQCDTSDFFDGEPEGIEFDPGSGTLFVGGFPSDRLAQLTTDCSLVRYIDISAAEVTKPAGLALAPGSVNPAVVSLWVADRGEDNDSDPDENDGRIFEFALPFLAPVNAPPVVSAGPDLFVGYPSSVQLQGSVTDDGRPSPGSVTSTWSKVSGPGTVTFGNSRQPSTSGSFSQPGVYVLRLTGDDGALQSSDDVTITAVLPGVPLTLEKRVGSSTDDAEETSSGSTSTSSSDLELGLEGGSPQIVGLRFSGLGIPARATISEAWIQFGVDETGSSATTLALQAEAADNSAPFQAAARSISSRTRTAASVTWSPAAWTTVGAAGPDQRTPDLRALLQEVVSRPGWASGNALAVIVSGTGVRTAKSFEGDAAGAPILHVRYLLDLNVPPVVTITAPSGGTSVTQGSPVTFTATATDPEDGNLSAGVSWASSLDGALGTGATLTRSSLSIGTHTITASVSDSKGRLSSASLSLTVTLPSNAVIVEKRVGASADDAEEGVTSGSVTTASGDLGMALDGSTPQIVGVRFSGLAIPQGATIFEAWIQFGVDETGSGAATLTLQAQTADNSAAFQAAAQNISSRTRTAAAVTWSPAAWTTVGAAGPAQRTPDLRAILQQVVSRPGWASGNALAVIVSGTGGRIAKSFDGDAAGAPLLHVGYVPVPNTAPVVTITAPSGGTSVTQGSPVTFTATATDAEDGNLSAGVSWTSSLDGALGTGATLTRSLSVGTHTITASVSDSRGLRSSASLSLAVTLPSNAMIVEKRVGASADDAEESVSSGSVTTASSDLGMALDGSTAQIVGIRFAGLGVPQGATIFEAWIQFGVDETGSGATTLTLQAQSADNPVPFQAATGNISSRTRTVAAVTWSPAAWTTVGAAGPAQRTPDLRSVLQEIVSRPGWASGNALAVIVSGTGGRMAKSFDGDAAGAPLLHVGYVPVPNAAPVVTITAPSGGTSVTQGSPVTFTATATDPEDGNLSAGVSWTSSLDGALGTGATLTRSDLSVGTHTITASVTDSRGLRSSASLSLTVALPSNAMIVEKRVGASADDAEESVSSGNVTIASGDLGMAVDGSTAQIVGIRFAGLGVPRGATIFEAWIQFGVDETGSGATTLTLQAQAADNPAPFQAAVRNISTRTRTAAAVTWSPAVWTTVGAAGPAQRTPDLRSILQEVVSRPGWASGNALAVIVSGTGGRMAKSFDGDAAGAPLLHVGYVSEPNTAPVVTITAPPGGTSVTQGSPVTFTATATDPEDGGMSAGVSWTSSLDGALGTGATLTHSGLSAGTHTITASVSDSRGEVSSDDLTLTVTPRTTTLIAETRVAASADDAEEGAGGGVSLTSSDLEMTLNGTNQQTLGIRFSGLAIPQGATIVRAWIQFKVDEVSPDATSLLLAGEAIGSATPFLAVSHDVTSRQRTAASVSWSPAVWTTVGAAGPDQRTPDLRSVLQEIVSRPGWASGNALAIFVSGTGRRVARSFDADAAGAPLLHVEFVTTVNAGPPLTTAPPAGGKRSEPQPVNRTNE